MQANDIDVVTWMTVKCSYYVPNKQLKSNLLYTLNYLVSQSTNHTLSHHKIGKC